MPGDGQAELLSELYTQKLAAKNYSSLNPQRIAAVNLDLVVPLENGLVLRNLGKSSATNDSNIVIPVAQPTIKQEPKGMTTVVADFTK